MAYTFKNKENFAGLALGLVFLFGLMWWSGVLDQIAWRTVGPYTMSELPADELDRARKVIIKVESWPPEGPNRALVHGTLTGLQGALLLKGYSRDFELVDSWGRSAGGMKRGTPWVNDELVNNP